MTEQSTKLEQKINIKFKDQELLKKISTIMKN